MSGANSTADSYPTEVSAFPYVRVNCLTEGQSKEMVREYGQYHECEEKSGTSTLMISSRSVTN